MANPKRIPSLDGYRAIAIALVIVSHLGIFGGLTGDLLGRLGVRIFFVLSGFLITTLLLAEMKEHGGIDLWGFYKRRTLRIFPAFYTYLLILAALSAFSLIHLQPNDLLESATYTINYFQWDSQSNFVRHIWSLSNEEQFYLLWPACLLLTGKRKAIWLLIAVLVAEPLFRLSILLSGSSLVLTLDRRFDCVSDALATGCLLACLHARLHTSTRYIRFLRSGWVFAALALLLGAASTQSHPRIYVFVASSVMNICIAVAIDRWITLPSGPVGRALNSSIIGHLGTMSYSLYLWQQLFLTHGSEWWHKWPANIVLSVTAATGSLYLIEKPFLRLKDQGKKNQIVTRTILFPDQA